MTGTPVVLRPREREQRSAVDEFARWHDTHEAAAGRYSSLIPLEAPGPGEQFAFDVDLDRCTGCQSCVAACHSLNGLDQDESWRSVGSVIGRRGDPMGQQAVTTACHHCVEPACLAGCPVDAYEKDPVTGIVAHLDDQCIGCSYCTLTCPYEVPVLNRDRGIVRKCDMCAGRLAAGEAPACVQACPTDAISVRIVSRDEVPVSGRLVPGAPPSELTRPTTTYRSRHDLSGMSQQSHLVTGTPHMPLAVMLVLTQLSVGAFGLGLFWGTVRTGPLALFLAVAALAASTLHLGRPHLAWRALIGLRHSWLSREILAFTLYSALAATHSIMVLSGRSGTSGAGLVVAVLALVAGAGGVTCSALVYAVTGRRWWRMTRVVPLFALSALVSGGGLVLVVMVLTGHAPADVRGMVTVVVAASVAKTTVDLGVLVHWRRPATERGRTARLLVGPLGRRLVGRLLAGVLGGAVLPPLMISLTVDTPGVVRWCAGGLLVGSLLVGELLERQMFFEASSPPKMPGVLP